MSSRYDEIEASRLPTVFLEDLESILPQVLVVRRRMSSSGDSYISNVAIYDSMPNAEGGKSKGCIADDFELSPLAEACIDAKIKAQEEIQRRHRALDESLNNTLRSIMAGL